ncbi:succinylglutamate-semialdehyde dehydrogenase [Sphingomonas oligoaromativorans]|uniref:succinylglutamate-semialdehyde dehydrogenase n=1 Tax=Sphingomonas oligoaromativorans TaxID=575322 RepID=UPI00141F5AB4|nr:succinylglutamate-semialdehyde dehydrogenase [Sphingomonas oligoaromativorans]NIJ34657.1 succinylglutamic semialdehyde dehydrogenase [Sphingomonas oligoaromativorans]
MTRFISTNPSTGETLWEGDAAGPEQVHSVLAKARTAFEGWSVTPLDERIAFVRAFKARLEANAETLASAISQETGKPAWEGKQEAATMVAKVETSIKAQAERAGEREQGMAFGRAILRHRPHGVMAVLGPYNFPGHLPNGHIVPALLAGDTVVFKPSEETPLVGEIMAKCWAEAGLPEGVFNLVQGGRDTGAALLDGHIDGLLFTGSAGAGAHFRRVFVDRPEVILALELGGNNPLIAWDGDTQAIASIVVQSAFITSGQRCSCARRLIVPEGAEGDRMVDAVAQMTDRLTIGQWDETPEPTFGPLISAAAADKAREAVAALVAKGAKVIRPFEKIAGRSDAYVTPAILDVTGLDVPDAEIFAPVLQVIRVADFDAAIRAANATAYGLSGGLISADEALWRRYADRARAGVLNWNRPTTGAAGTMPFGGLGSSGNHRPSAYYAADYCAYPVASFEAGVVADLSGEIKGLKAAG